MINAAHQFGWLVHHVKPARTPDGAFLTRIAGDAGFPDLCLVRERVIFVELKSAMGRTRPEQDAWLDRLEAAGAEVYLWRPEDWLDSTIVETLKERRAVLAT